MVDAGLDTALGDRASLGVSYSGQFGSRATDNGVRANFRLSF